MSFSPQEWLHVWTVRFSVPCKSGERADADTAGSFFEGARQTTAQTPAKSSRSQARAACGAATEIRKVQVGQRTEVILSEDHRLPLVAVNLWYHVGPANEVPGRTGFAHLFEHMMFEGSRHVPGSSHFHYLEAAGASDINGTTDFDRTIISRRCFESTGVGAVAGVRPHGIFAGQAGPGEPFESAGRSA